MIHDFGIMIYDMMRLLMLHDDADDDGGDDGGVDADDTMIYADMMIYDDK